MYYLMNLLFAIQAPGILSDNIVQQVYLLSDVIDQHQLYHLMLLFSQHQMYVKQSISVQCGDSHIGGGAVPASFVCSLTRRGREMGREGGSQRKGWKLWKGETVGR